MGSEYVSLLTVADFADPASNITEVGRLLEAMAAERSRIPKGGLLRLDFEHTNDMLASGVEQIADFCHKFPHHGDEQYLLFANLPNSINHALNDALTGLAVTAVHEAGGRPVPFGYLNDSLIQVVNDVTDHPPHSRVDEVASRLQFSGGFASDVLAQAYGSRILGRTRLRILPASLRRHIPPTLSRFRGFVYFPLWLPDGNRS